MRKHRDLIAPKFAAVDAALTAKLSGLGIAEWSHPIGGYFVDLNVVDGTAARTVQPGQGGRHRADARGLGVPA